MPEDDYKKKQSQHATKIATERALMETFGLTRAQARKLNDGLLEYNSKLDDRRASEPEVLGPPMPPQIDSETVESRAPRPNEMAGWRREGTPGQGGRGGGTPTAVRAVVDVGGVLSAAVINVLVE